jgi:hypothetical protein
MPEESTTPDLVELTRDVTGVANRHDLGPRVVPSMIEMYAIYLNIDEARAAAERLAKERG